MGETETVFGGRQNQSQQSREAALAAVPLLEAWILSKPASTTGSKIASQAGDDDSERDTLVSTPEQQVVQVLLVQAQNEVTMATSTPLSAPCTPTAARSTAPLTPVTGSSTMDSLNPIGANLGAQDTPSVSLGVFPAICTAQPIVVTQRYATMPHISSMSDTPLLAYTPSLASTPAPTYSIFTAPQPLSASVPYANTPATSARPAAPMGYYGQSNKFAFMPNPNWISEREHMLQQQLLLERQQFTATLRASQAQPQPQPPICALGPPLPVEESVDINARSASSTIAKPTDQTNASTSRRSPSPNRGYPRGTCTATWPSQASPKQTQGTVSPAQDLQAFKADMTSMLSDMLKTSPY